MNWRVLAPALVLLVMGLWTPVTMSPDSLDALIAGRCALGLPLEAVNCAELNLLYYPPVFPLVSALASLLCGPWTGLVLACALGASLLVLPAGGLAERCGVRGSFWMVVVLVVAMPSLRFYGMAADPRLACIALILAAWALALDESKRKPVNLFFAGLLAGAAVLTRPEGLVYGGLVLVFLAVVARRKSVWAGLGFSVLALPWWILLTLQKGSLALSSRSWELRGAGLVDLLPVRWLVQLWGVGAHAPPFREFLAAADAPVPVAGDPMASLATVASILLGVFPWWIWLAALLGVVLASRKPEGRSLLLVLALVAGPALLISLAPMGLDLGLPLKNLLPVVIAVVLMAAVGLASVGRQVVRIWPEAPRSTLRVRADVATGMLALLILLWGLPHHYLEDRYWPETSQEGLEATAWLVQNTAPEAVIASSFGSSPVAHRAHRRWVPIPSPWEFAPWSDVEQRPSYLVVTGVDGIWPFRSPYLREVSRLEPQAFFAGDSGRGWAMVLSIEAPSL